MSHKVQEKQECEGVEDCHKEQERQEWRAWVMWGLATKYRRRRRGGLCEGVGGGHKVQESQELGDEGVTSFLDSNLGEPKFINIP